MASDQVLIPFDSGKGSLLVIDEDIPDSYDDTKSSMSIMGYPLSVKLEERFPAISLVKQLKETS